LLELEPLELELELEPLELELEPELRLEPAPELAMLCTNTINATKEATGIATIQPW
jgi:hypothetical protein